MDDLSNGINPLLIVIQDHTSPDNEEAHFASLSAAHDCDNLFSGSTTMDLTNRKSLCATVKVQVPTTCMVDWLMLKACVLILATLLGEICPVLTNLAAVGTHFTKSQVADNLVWPMRLVHCVQLQMHA